MVLDCAAVDIVDIAVRLGAATLVGVLLGLNRDLHGKSTGVRTLGLVCLGPALAVLSIHAATGAQESRVIQGIVTGVGFLGAGVIIRSARFGTTPLAPKAPDRPDFHRQEDFARRFARKGREIALGLRRRG